MIKNKQLFSSKRQNWRTPQKLYDKQHRKHKFDLDVAADATNAKCKRYLGPGSSLGEDALKVDWSKIAKSVWCNPPYGRGIFYWVRKAYEESLKGVKVVMLIAARPDTRAFHKYIFPYAHVKFIKGRLKFDDGDDPAPFPSCIVTFYPRKKPPVDLPRDFRPKIKVLQGDCRDKLRKLPDESVQCCVTSPPYLWARSYSDAREEIGREPTLDEYIESLVDAFREVRRVLKPDGTFWLNIGDTYASNARMSDMVFGNPEFNKNRPSRSKTRRPERYIPDGLKQKDQILVPFRLALALQADGWYVRNDIIWQKVRPMPESVTDRFVKSHEFVFLLAKSEKYFCNPLAVREAAVSGHSSGNGFKRECRESFKDKNGARGSDSEWKETEWRNPRDVWLIDNKPTKFGHYAVFPEDLAERCILAGSNPCDTVLDPFSGAFTTAVVAKRLKRNFVGVELNPEYIEIGIKRLKGEI